MEHNVQPKFQHHCDKCYCLGHIVVNGKGADLFVCADTVIARYSDDRDDYEATHMAKITALSSVFLLAAFRLYLEHRGERAVQANLIHASKSLQS